MKTKSFLSFALLLSAHTTLQAAEQSGVQRFIQMTPCESVPSWTFGCSEKADEYHREKDILEAARSKDNLEQVIVSLCSALEKDKTKANITNLHGESPLHTACKHGLKAQVAVLLFAGADVNALSEKVSPEFPGGWSPLHYAAACPLNEGDYNQIGLASYLLHQGANPLLPTKEEGYLPLHIATLMGKAELVNFFLMSRNHNQIPQNAGTFTDANGWSSLHHAVATGNIHVLAALAGGRTFRTDEDKKRFIITETPTGETPLELATRLKHTAMAAYLTALEKAEDEDSANEKGPFCQLDYARETIKK